MFNLGWPEVLLIVIALFFVFGPKKIPEIGRALGKTLRGFKEEVQNSSSDNHNTDPD
jgi:sec-independent protein translocase protein TatA